MLNEENAENSAIYESAQPVAPAKTAHERREDKAHEENDLQVVAMLPDNNRVLVKIRDISPANPLRILLHQHPAEMGVEKTLANRIWVLVGISVAVMGAMVPGPPSHGSFDSTSANQSEKDPEWECSGIRRMCPQSMVT